MSSTHPPPYHSPAYKQGLELHQSFQSAFHQLSHCLSTPPQPQSTPISSHETPSTITSLSETTCVKSRNDQGTFLGKERDVMGLLETMKGLFEKQFELLTSREVDISRREYELIKRENELLKNENNIIKTQHNLEVNLIKKENELQIQFAQKEAEMKLEMAKKETHFSQLESSLKQFELQLKLDQTLLRYEKEPLPTTHNPHNTQLPQQPFQLAIQPTPTLSQSLSYDQNDAKPVLDPDLAKISSPTQEDSFQDSLVFPGDQQHSSKLDLYTDDDSASTGDSMIPHGVLNTYIEQLAFVIRQQQVELTEEVDLERKNMKHLLQTAIKNVQKEKSQLHSYQIWLGEQIVSLHEKEVRIIEKESVIETWKQSQFQPIITQLKRNLKTWEDAENKRQIAKREQDDINDSLDESQEEFDFVPKSTQLELLFIITNLNKQITLTGRVEDYKAPLISALYNTGEFFSIFEHFFQRDYISGKIPPLKDDLKLYFSTPHVQGGKWIQFHGPGNLFELYDPNEVILSQFSLCDFNKKKPTKTTSDIDRCNLSPEDCMVQHKETDVNFPIYHSSPAKEYNVDYVINIKWEISPK